MRVGDADACIGPRPKRRPAFAERQISGVEDEPLAVGAIGKRGGSEKQGVCRAINAKIGSCQAVGMIIYVAERSLEALERIITVGRETLQKR